jgi:hypothetical protein
LGEEAEGDVLLIARAAEVVYGFARMIAGEIARVWLALRKNCRIETCAGQGEMVEANVNELIILET